MAFWMELRCDVHGRGCYSDQNNGPMALSKHTMVAVNRNRMALEREALRDGWTRVPIGFACPVCSEALK